MLGRHGHGNPVAHRGHDARLGGLALGKPHRMLGAKRPTLARHERKPAVETNHASHLERGGVRLAQALGHAGALNVEGPRLLGGRRKVLIAGQVVQLVRGGKVAQHVGGGNGLRPTPTTTCRTAGRAAGALARAATGAAH